MSFGKYEGRHVRDVPTGYLKWVARECDCVEASLLAAILAELWRRGVNPATAGRANGGNARQAGPCFTCVKMRNEIASEFRKLTLIAHPDRGGDDRLMAAVNNAYERLQAALR